MLIPLSVVLGIGCFFIHCALRQRRLRGIICANDECRVPYGIANIGSHFAIFDRPSRWLAVRTGNAAAVQSALRLQHVAPCSWEAGLGGSTDGKLFVSPPISGWVLVVGSGLPEPSDDIDSCYKFLKDLSRKLGGVQFYSVNRALNHHAWVLLDGGQVFRAYAWAGETLWNEGILTAAERDLDMVCFDYGTEVNNFTAREAISGDTEKLYQLAGRWSVDPAAIPRATWNVHGIVGDI